MKLIATVLQLSLSESSCQLSDQPSKSISTACWNPNPHADEGLDIDASNSVNLVPMGTTVLRWTAFPPAR